MDELAALLVRPDVLSWLRRLEERLADDAALRACAGAPAPEFARVFAERLVDAAVQQRAADQAFYRLLAEDPAVAKAAAALMAERLHQRVG